MLPAMRAPVLLLAHVVASAAHSDLISYLPGYGAPETKQYSGFVDATPDGKNKLFYYFVEADIGSSSPSTPFLIWLNGGPGSSSMLGLLSENLGPQQMTPDGTLVSNPHRITKKYHLMAVDNPVGAGYSFTENGAYVTSEEEMRVQFLHALREFYKRHPEYKENPLWITGESYAGKYVPEVAYEVSKSASEIPLQGIVVGNGIYDASIQYKTVGLMGFAAGVIDENTLEEVHRREAECVAAIQEKRTRAGDFCENVTVRWLYTDTHAIAGQMIYYDLGISDASFLGKVFGKLSKFMNRPDVKKALHAENATWFCTDETGPVAEALYADFTIPSVPQVVALLEQGKQVTMYNGVRDGSVCNHIGNLKVILNMKWSGSKVFASAKNVPWPSQENVMGHWRSANNFHYATVLRTGHMVPSIVPESFAIMLEKALSNGPVKSASRQAQHEILHL